MVGIFRVIHCATTAMGFGRCAPFTHGYQSVAPVGAIITALQGRWYIVWGVSPTQKRSTDTMRNTATICAMWPNVICVAESHTGRRSNREAITKCQKFQQVPNPVRGSPLVATESPDDVCAAPP